MKKNALGKAIIEIQKGKQIPVSNITRCGVSKSQYFRFVKGESSLRVESFLSLINELNVTIDEFLYIARGYKEDPYRESFRKLQRAFYDQNLDKLQEISLYSDQKYNETQIDKYKHINALSDILISRLQNMPVPSQSLAVIKDYIFSLNLWSHYDLCLFINVMFVFKIDDVRFLIKRMKRDENKFSDFKSNISEQFRLWFNLIIMDIEQNNKNQLLQDISEIQTFQLSDQQVLEHILAKYVLHLKTFVTNGVGMNELNKIQHDLADYQIKSYAGLLQNINMFLETSFKQSN
ncbi:MULTISPECIES: helix-turn-helix domain-containing protein [Lacticaseibacillus]|uniref:HTH cro/C1-type domain-containing protein n=3 Tax=Lacticaseibacillus TaxID=2759736 RepID=A0AAN1F145_LACCA|nr:MULTISPECIES: Rgg/GadR/MutR family transcriptional regulator [Lacticaseibacillus]ARY92880.1 hypothetical protein BGL52_14345 [Lacticaseibacillus casei]KAB1970093.1 hypothetical protein F9B82_06980 [Lacticaseibacillus casei]MDE3281077.1 hypothetical protein [Lacticaseibacillus casei]WLV78010.1 hypothetical protein LACPH_002794 [Lacticaseibacillus sp. NCIMB 15471]WLV80782.1 hypothetical protein LACSTY_002875 [Lacticaseibacillus sp. NCIMB 15473]